MDADIAEISISTFLIDSGFYATMVLGKIFKSINFSRKTKRQKTVCYFTGMQKSKKAGLKLSSSLFVLGKTLNRIAFNL